MTYERVTTEKRSLLGGGLSLVTANWRCLTWIYFVNLVLGIIATLPLINQVDGQLGHSLAARNIAGRLDLGYVLELARLLGDKPTGLASSVSAMHILFVLFMVIVTPAVLSIYLGDELASMGNMLRTGLQFFWRMVRLTIVFAVVGGILLGILSMARGALLTRIDLTHVERAYFAWSAATFLVVLAAALVVRIWFDMAQLLTVERGTYRIGRVEDRAIRRTIGPSWRLLRAGFARLYLSYVLIAVVGFALFALVMLLWHALPPRANFLAFVLGQVCAFILIVARLWERGVTVTWFDQAAALVTPVVTPLVEPVVPPVREEPVLQPDPGTGPLPGPITDPPADPIPEPA